MINPSYLQDHLDGERADRDQARWERYHYGPAPKPLSKEITPVSPIPREHGPHEWERYPWFKVDDVWWAVVGECFCRVRLQFDWEPKGVNFRVNRMDDPEPDWGLFWTHIEWRHEWSFEWNIWNAMKWAVRNARQV